MADILMICGFSLLLLCVVGSVVGLITQAPPRYVVLVLIGGLTGIGLALAGSVVRDDDTREECGVVGTSAEDAVYVCIEVTE